MLSTAVTPDPVEPGGQLNIALTVTNTDAFDRSDVVLQLRWPEEFQRLDNAFISDGGGCPGGGRCDTNEFLTWNLGTLKGGSGITVTLPPAVIPQIVPGAEIELEDIEVSDSSGDTVSASHTVMVTAERALELSLDTAVDPVPSDAELVYTLVYGHSRATALATGVAMSLSLPEEVTFISASDGGSHDSGTVAWALGDLGPGEIGREQVVVRVAGGLPDGHILPAEARLTGDGEPETIVDLIRRVAAETPLRVAIEAHPDPVEPGEQMQHLALTVSNTSAFDRSGITLAVRWPGPFQRLSNAFVSDGGGCPGGGRCDTNEFLTWNLGTLKSGTGITLTLPPLVSEGVDAGSLIELAPTVQDNSGLRVRTKRTVPISDRRLALAVAEQSDPVRPGQTAVWDLAIGLNTASTQATGLTLTLPLPAGTELVAAPGGGLTEDDQIVWDLGTLVSGEIAMRRVELLVDPAIAHGELVAGQASLASAEGDEVRADAVARVESQSPLQTTIEVRDPTPSGFAGETLETWLTAENNSPFPRTDVRLSLRYPRHLQRLNNSLISDSGRCPGGGRCDTNEFLTWTFANLQAEGMIDVSLPPEVGDQVPPGSLIQFDAVVEDSTARSRTESLFPVGTLVFGDESLPLAWITGAPAFADPGASFTADGSGSSDPDGAIASYAWTISGPCSTSSPLDGTTLAVTVDADAPVAFPSTPCRLELTVTDDVGLAASHPFATIVLPGDAEQAMQEAYIAYYGRPADPVGLHYWGAQLADAGGALDGLIAAYGTSEEYTSRFGGLSDEDLINTLFRNLFGRDADPAGLEYYLNPACGSAIGNERVEYSVS